MRSQADHVASISTIAIIGGGAVGVQMATDIKEIYPEKSVTLIHSRETVMNRFHRNLDEIVKQRCTKLGVRMKLGARVKLPAEGYPTDGRHFNVELEDGSSIPAQLAVNSDLLVFLITNTTDRSLPRLSALVRPRSQGFFDPFRLNPSTRRVIFGHGRHCKLLMQNILGSLLSVMLLRPGLRKQRSRMSSCLI